MEKTDGRESRERSGGAGTVPRPLPESVELAGGMPAATDEALSGPRTHEPPAPPTELGAGIVQHPGAMADAGAAGADASSATMVDGGGTVLSQAHLQLIYWGSAWSNRLTTPAMADVTDAVANILAGPYMSRLSQYRGVGPAVLRGTTLVDTSNPPNPFSDQNVKDLVSNLIDAGTLPEPDDEGTQIVYCVVMPPMVNFVNGNVIGEHTYDTDYDFPFDFDKMWIAWVTNNGTLDSLTRIFSHELAEVCTDPEGDGFQVAPSNPNSWNEIGDICSSTGRINGVLVQSYWSASDNACVVPTGLPNWQSLGGQINGGLSALRNQDGRLEVFTRGTDGALWHQWQTAPNNGWSGWASLGGWITGLNVVAANADGRLEVFARGGDGALWHSWQTAPNNGWSDWNSLGGSIDNVFAVANNADGRLEAFARGGDGALWHIWQTAPNNGWSGWDSLGGQIQTALTVGTNQDGRLEVFAKGLDGALWHQWQTAPNNGWSGWASLGGALLDLLTVTKNQDGRVEVFVRGTDGALWHQWQTAPNNGWSGWASLGGVINDVLTAAQNADGRIEVFARGTDNALWHQWQTAPNNGWSGWATMGGGIADLLAANRNADGRLEVFVRGFDNGLWHVWQTAPNNGWNT
jgi:hypothetical protein